LVKEIHNIVKNISGHFEHWVTEPRFPDSEDLRLVLTAEIEPDVIVESPEWGRTWNRCKGSGFIIFPEFKLGSRLVDPKEIADNFTKRIIMALTQHKGGLDLKVKKLDKILEAQKRDK